MNLREIQVEHRAWLAHNFPDQTIEDCFMGMAEELGEIAHSLLKRKQGIRGEALDHAALVRDGCADLIIFMMGLADHENFDLFDAVNEAWDEVAQRDWVQFPGNGVNE